MKVKNYTLLQNCGMTRAYLWRQLRINGNICTHAKFAMALRSQLYKIVH